MAVEKRKKKRTTNYFIILGKIHSMRSDFMLIALVSVFIIFHLRRRRLFWILRLFSRRAHGSNENFKLNLLLGLHTALNLRIHFEMMAHPLSIWDQKGKYAEWNRQTDGGILLQTSVRQKSTGTFFILFFLSFLHSRCSVSYTLQQPNETEFVCEYVTISWVYYTYSKRNSFTASLFRRPTLYFSCK